ncbi:MAG: hypothetical protein KIT88_03885 [Phycisphaeraceae bacterium]|nr:hypothetical protein [Phycisphaeraceae bacterium]
MRGCRRDGAGPGAIEPVSLGRWPGLLSSGTVGALRDARAAPTARTAGGEPGRRTRWVWRERVRMRTARARFHAARARCRTARKRIHPARARSRVARELFRGARARFRAAVLRFPTTGKRSKRRLTPPYTGQSRIFCAVRARRAAAGTGVSAIRPPGRSKMQEHRS